MELAHLQCELLFKALEIFAVRGLFIPLTFKHLSHNVSDDNQHKGIGKKSRRDDRTQTGVTTPGNSAATKKALKGRQKHKQTENKQVACSVALSELSFVDHLVPGVSTPVCVLSHLRCFSSEQQ